MLQHADQVVPLDGRVSPCHAVAMIRVKPLLRCLLLTTAALLSGCRDAPSEVLDQARNALAEVNRIPCNKAEPLQEALVALSQHLEPRAAALLLAAPQVERAASGQFKVFASCKPPPSILPMGEVLKSEVGERVARVTVQAKGHKHGVMVPMVLVDGRWKIALLDMESLERAIAVQ